MAEDAVVVEHPSDVSLSRQTARVSALAAGFDEKASEEIAVVAGELASNLLRHAGGGTIRVVGLRREGQAGVQIEALDSGPGIADVEQALVDGFSTAGGLGYGLGAVNRLMDELEIVSPQTGSGTHVVCRRWVHNYPAGSAFSPLEFGVATRPHPLMDVNGDSFVLKRWDNSALVGLIDGVGHGQHAHEAAEAARHYVEEHFDRPLEAVFRGTDRACQATRGVVMALARFTWRDMSDGRATFSFASVGNIEARGFSEAGPFELVPRRGVIGANAPKPVITENVWTRASLLVLHSDGVRSHWRWDDYSQLHDEAAPAGAARLLRTLGRETDDATAMVVKGTGGSARPGSARPT